MKSKYDGYSFPLRDSVQRERYAFATASNWQATYTCPAKQPEGWPP